ncbi:2'-5' RNA ligase [Thermodesulfatator indicus DSM 15286]|uniref:RNA 2',3'-cyclic phosphodiesterase n=1 Tax=Thermodesulfatator indicus (strain DSM 15286 / JCM 11887 / CIR29812) TaxID=667014 RepID=F8ADI8_THEID|nr:RNA 2',3'-cyclic phosphodiesterase [Thermodesulfatator indicus]AEH44862.1 2'-5' RNA ligase [Thermodesulfatator indicus DSM 15286]
MARLFLAISLPAKIKEKLKSLQEDLAKTQAHVRWVRPEGIHLTLKFFGEVPEEKTTQLIKAIEKVLEREKPGLLRFKVKDLGVFPNPRSPRVIWAGLEGDLVKLAKLQRHLEEAFIPLGFPMEKRAFVPHLTLGRIKSPRKRNVLMAKVADYQEKNWSIPDDIEIEEIVLYESKLHPEGAIYTPRKRFPLT